MDTTTHARSALLHTQSLIDRFGGRLAGTERCRQAAEALCAALERACGSARLEPFVTHPEAFTLFYRIDALLYLVGLALLLLGQPLPAGLVLLGMVCAAGLQFGYYWPIYDRFYPKATCYNVSAVLEPRGPARRQLILSGHHDSAKELRFLKGSQKLYGLKILVPDATRATAAVFAWTWVFHDLFTGEPPAFTPYMLGLLVIGIFFVFTKFWLFEPWPVPGAGDNLIASTMLVELAEALRDPERPGRSLLESTRLIFVSFDAEESALRGSLAWAAAHRAEIESASALDVPTFALNIDSIYNAADLQFLISDLNDHIPLDCDLAARCQRIAAQAGLPAKTKRMVFGGGSTDAAALAQIGICATTMLAMPTGLVRDGLVYHTMRDTVDAIQPEAVSACLDVAYRLAQAIDKDEITKAQSSRRKTRRKKIS